MKHRNEEFGDPKIGNEAIKDLNETIVEMNKYKRRRIVMPKESSYNSKRFKSELRDREIEKVIRFLWIRPAFKSLTGDMIITKSATTKEIHQHLFGRDFRDNQDKKYTENLLQILRYATMHIVQAFQKRWIIDPHYVSSIEELISTAKANKNARFKNSEDNKRKRESGEIIKPKKINKDKKIVIDGMKNENKSQTIEIPVGDGSITIVISKPDGTKVQIFI